MPHTKPYVALSSPLYLHGIPDSQESVAQAEFTFPADPLSTELNSYFVWFSTTPRFMLLLGVYQIKSYWLVLFEIVTKIL